MVDAVAHLVSHVDADWLQARHPYLQAWEARLTTAIIEHFRRRESSVEEVMIDRHIAGVSTGRIESAFEIPWGPSVSVVSVSNLSEGEYYTPLRVLYCI